MSRALEILCRRAKALGERIVSGTGAGAVTCVFAGGGVATGRVAWYEGDELEILSDIDLYVVADAGHVDDVRRVAAAAGELGCEPGVRLLRPDDIGVYTLDDLLSQPARPGTVGLADHHYHVFGDESVYDRLREAIGATVESTEGMYLLENRIAEMPGHVATADEPQGRLARYRLVRTVLDTATALLIGAGRYDGSPVTVEALAALPGTPPGWDPELTRRALAAQADLASFFAGGGEAIARDDAVDLALAVWRWIGAREFDEDPADWAAIVVKRCHIGDYPHNFREFLAMSAARGRSRKRMAWSGAHLSRYSPVTALRLFGLVEMLRRRDDIDVVSRRTLESVEAYVERLTDAFGCSDGSLAERVARMRRGG